MQDAIIAFVHLAIATALKTIRDALNLAVFVVDSVINELGNLVTIIISQIALIFQWIGAEAVRVSGWINAGIDWLWNNVAWPAISDVRRALDAAAGLLNVALSALVGSVDWLIANLIDPLWAWVQSAASVVGGWVGAAIAAFYHDVIAPILSVVQQAAHDVSVAIGWITSDGYLLWQLIDRAWGWLVWLGDHAYEDVVSSIHAITHPFTGDFVREAAETGREHIDVIADYFDKVLS